MCIASRIYRVKALHNLELLDQVHVSLSLLLSFTRAASVWCILRLLSGKISLWHQHAHVPIPLITFEPITFTKPSTNGVH